MPDASAQNWEESEVLIGRREDLDSTKAEKHVSLYNVAIDSVGCQAKKQTNKQIYFQM